MDLCPVRQRTLFTIGFPWEVAVGVAQLTHHQGCTFLFKDTERLKSLSCLGDKKESLLQSLSASAVLHLH